MNIQLVLRSIRRAHLAVAARTPSSLLKGVAVAAAGSLALLAGCSNDANGGPDVPAAKGTSVSASKTADTVSTASSPGDVYAECVFSSTQASGKDIQVPPGVTTTADLTGVGSKVVDMIDQGLAILPGNFSPSVTGVITRAATPTMGRDGAEQFAISAVACAVAPGSLAPESWDLVAQAQAGPTLSGTAAYLYKSDLLSRLKDILDAS